MVPCIICTHLNLHLSLNRKSTVGWVGGKRRNWKESIRVRVSVMYVCTDMYVCTVLCTYDIIQTDTDKPSIVNTVRVL